MPHIHPEKICQTSFPIQFCQLRDQFLADLDDRLIIRLYNNIGRRLIFLPAFLHQICYKFYIVVSLQQRSVITVFYTLVDCLGTCSEKDDTSVLFISTTFSSRRATPPPQDIIQLLPVCSSFKSSVSRLRKYSSP